MAQKRILIIEDNPVNMELASDLLDAAGYATLQADNAEDGVRLAQSDTPDLVLMDIALPGMDGLTATALLRQGAKTAHIPIVALTAHAMTGDEEKALAMGCIGYITKPINTRTFAKMVSDFSQRTNDTALTLASTIVAETVFVPEIEKPVNKPVERTVVPPMVPPTRVQSPAQPTAASGEILLSATAEAQDDALLLLPEVPMSAGAQPTRPDLQFLEADTVVPPFVPVEKPRDKAKSTKKQVEAEESPYLLIPRRGRGGRQKEAIAIVAETSTAKILVVDDDELNREMITAQLRLLGYDAIIAEDGFQALDLLDDTFDLVLLDYMMPGMDGCEVCHQIREEKHLNDLPVIMVTALSNREDQLRAVQMGANDWITKPVDRNELAVRVKSHLKFKAAQDALRQHQRDLEATVRARTADLRKALEQVTKEQERTQEAYLDTMHRLALAAEFRDGFMAAAHIRCVGNYCAAIARGMGLPENVAEVLLHAAPLHDIGMLGVPEVVVHKTTDDRSSDEETTYRDHTVLGARLLSGARSELLRAAEVIALSHHEKWDGTGFPHGRSGESIPLYGRICAVADAFDALTAYKGDEWQATNDEAKEVLSAGRGTDFDPAVIDAFFKQWNEIETFQKRYRRTEAPPEDLFPRKLVA
jgi:putative two-component system response regulator